MSLTEEYQRLLQVTPETPWPEVLRSYRDLIRVWHPDRFQSDERLRMRAEEETRKLNIAIEHLKEVFERNQKELGSGFKPPPKNSTQNQNFSRPPSPSEDPSFQESNFSFSMAPLEARVRTFVALRRIIGAGLMVCSGLYILRLSFESLSSSIGCLMSFAGLHLATLNLWHFVSRTPIIRVDKSGIFTSTNGTLPWGTFLSVRSSRTSGVPTLSIECTMEHVKKLSFPRRLLFTIRRYIYGAHVLIPLQGLNYSGPAIVNALQLQQASGDIQFNPDNNPQKITISTYCYLLAIACVVIATLRTGLRFSKSPYECGFYLCLYTLLLLGAYILNARNRIKS